MAKFTVIENDKDIDYEQEISRHKKKRKIIFIIVLIVAVALVLSYIIYRATKIYTDYNVLYSLDKESNDNSRCIKFKEGFLKYNNDGITYYDDSNKVVWQQSYEMKNPQVKVRGDYIAVANIGSSSIYILDGKGNKSTIDTALEITQIEVSKVGACVVTLEDNETNYIRMYDIKGNVVYDLKKVISGDGYPLDIAISEDATKLCVSTVYLEETTPKAKIFFYNFSEIGKNEVDSYVGGYDYDVLVPEVEFVTNDKVAVVSENSFTLYTMEQYPELESNVKFEFNISKVMQNNDKIAFVYETNEKESRYAMDVYNYKGKKVLTYKYNEDFTEALFIDNHIMLYNSSKARMIDIQGKTRFEYDFDIPLQDIVWVENEDRFVFINAKMIQQIKLK